jgi:DNA-binding response OmpR family regulator
MNAVGKKRILIIDDDPALRRLLQFGLERAGYATVTADHGGMAMAILGHESFDLITVDLMMPIMDGLRFLRWLRHEAWIAVPTLVFTSCDARNLAEEALAIGATGVAVKPVQLPEFLARVAGLLPT